jgi:hypothetical protein
MDFGSQLTDALHFVGVPGSILSPGGEQGLFFGNPKQFVAQVVALVFILLYEGLATFAICKAINVFVKLRLPDSQLEIGDVAVHGDVAYELLPPAAEGSSGDAAARTRHRAGLKGIARRNS